MGGDDVSGMVRCHTWSTYDQRDVDVLFVSTRLPGLETVLSDMKPIVTAVDYVSVVQDSVGFEAVKESVDHFINGLECA